jgi:predicted dehydrogenase
VAVVVGLVGCGGWGRHILRDLLALGCEVPVVARSEESRARAAEGGAGVIVSDVSSLPALDGVVVATPTSTHATVVEEALALGVPVFCEKPICDDLEDARRLAELAPGRLFVMDKWRYHPGVLELSGIAREETLGHVSGIKTLRIGPDVGHDDVDPVWVLAPHDLSIVLEVMGAVPLPEAAVGQWLDDRLLQVYGVLRGDGWWHALEVSARSPERVRRVELSCAEGVAVLAGGWDEHVSVFRSKGGEFEEERVETPGELPLLAELRAFVEHLKGGAPPRSSAAEGVSVVAAIADLRRLAW